MHSGDTGEDSDVQDTITGLVCVNKQSRWCKHSGAVDVVSGAEGFQWHRIQTLGFWE